MENLTPQEAWSGNRPKVHHLRVFGSRVFAHIPAQLRKKLDDRSKEYVFIGYDTSSKGYKLLDPLTLKVIASRDCKFDEAYIWDLKRLSSTHEKCLEPVWDSMFPSMVYAPEASDDNDNISGSGIPSMEHTESDASAAGEENIAANDNSDAQQYENSTGQHSMQHSMGQQSDLNQSSDSS
ncbi:hypothetical protein Dimus_017856, partial [Dionaea muscipula]